MSILITNVLLDRGIISDVYIQANKITAVGPNLTAVADIVIDGTDKAIIPGFVNGHTHAAMTLFRGFADDIALEQWLTEKIWPQEAKLTEEDVYWGSKLACLEMIKSGTTTFSDMYFHIEATVKAVEEMGMRALISTGSLDFFDPVRIEACKKRTLEDLEASKNYNSRIQLAFGPHAIYTVSGELLQWVSKLAIEQQRLVHLHLAETETEVSDCVAKHGLTPVRYLHKLGVLSPQLVLAHCIWIDEEEIALLAAHQVKVIHNPASNMKLASGYQFKYEELKQAGVQVGLGTDGPCSSNNLDMIEVMKLASLMGKVWRKNPEAVSATSIYKAATQSGYDIFGLNGGAIEVGKLADVCLVDLKTPAFTPNFNFISNLVYAANGNHIDTVICDGNILMQNRHVAGEEEILARTAHLAYQLVAR